jgi:CubicO group peptidase (beta-lactamase class C family)
MKLPLGILTIFCRAALAFLLFLFSNPLKAQHNRHHDTDPFTGLDTAFARVLKDWHAAGFAVAVVKKDSIIYANGFGYRDVEHKLPVTPHTLFAIGSCTKAFTGSLIGMLMEEGKVDIDRPVRDYLPELKFYNDEMNDKITLRDMMCHRTGLPRYDYSWFLFITPSRDSLIRKIRYMEPTAGIRDKWQYNNFMFAAQGLLVEKLTDHTWEVNIRQKIFHPLGMEESNVSIPEMQNKPDISLGYGVKKDSIIQKLDYHIIDVMAPAGSINSNVTDMAAWVKTWINNGKYQGKQIIPEKYRAEAISSQMIVGGALPSKESPDVFFSTYGFGWSLSTYRGHYRVEHGGNIDGFSASTSFFPADSIGIIVLTNQNASAVPSVVRNILADRVLQLGYRDWDGFLKEAADKARSAAKAGLAAKVSDRKLGTHLSHPLADYAGIYNNPAFGSFEITLERDSLFVSFPTQEWWLRHYHYDVFTPLDKDPKEGIDTAGQGLRMNFGMDPAGNIINVSLLLEPALNHPIVFVRSSKAQKINVEDLQKYVGEYSFGPQDAKIYVKNDALFLFVAGQPEYELVPVGKDKFTFKALPNFAIQFMLDDKGTVTGLQAIQPNGTFKATKKK